MEIIYKKANFTDIDFLISNRLEFINVTADNNENYEFIKKNIQQYFIKNLKQEQCDVILAEDCGLIIGTGIIFYYDSVPSPFNPWGKNAYITNMFVNEKYRRRGVGITILDKLIGIAKLKGYYIILLQASDMGKPLYKKYGFSDGKTGMLLKLKDLK